MDGPSPISITAAALIMQFSIILIMAVGAAALAWLGKFKVSGLTPTIILLLAIFSIGLLTFSDALSSTWAPLFGSSSFNGLKWSTSLFIVFIFNILAVDLLVEFTGGGLGSAFMPIYFIVPPMAIFLRESGGHLLIYLGSTILLFTFNLHSDFYSKEWDVVKARKGPEKESQGPYWLVSILCLILATLIGYVTRPR